MKTHTSDFKNNIKTLGKEIDSKITYTIGGTTIELGNEQLNSVAPHYEGGILKSVMRQLDIDSNVEIPLGTILTYQFGVKVSNQYEYINFGNYVVYKAEKQEDTNSWQITCYDKMLYAMKDYESLEVTYPITVRNYINALCTKLGLTFKNANSTFANYNKQITKELYLDEDGKTLGYTYRDVLDELAQVTASTICINENDDELEIRYINNTNDTIDEEYLKDVNVNFGEKYGPVNTIVLSRSAGADNIYYPSTLPSNPIEIKISDNQIMNGNDRDTYMVDIYNKLNGLEYYINDFSSTGICYYNLCDKYNVSIGGTTYSCIMFNDEVNVTQGLQENIYTDMPKESVTDYTKADKTDRRINQTTLIVDKQQGEITALVDTTEDIQKEINPTDNTTGSSIYLEDSTDAELVNFEMEGKTTQATSDNPVMPSPNYPSELVSVGYENLFSGFREISTNGTYENGVLKVSASGGGNCYSNYFIPTGNRTYYFNYISSYATARYYVAEYDSNYTQIRSVSKTAPQSFTIGNDASYFAIIWNFASGTTYPITISNMQLEKGASPHSYIPYGKYGIEIKTTGKNLISFTNQDFTVNNIRYYTNNGSLFLNGTSTGETSSKNANFKNNFNFTLPAGTYTISHKTGIIAVYLYKYNSDSSSFITLGKNVTSSSFTLTEETKLYIGFYVYQNSFSNAGVEIMIEKSTTATTYEEYKSKTYLYTLNEPLRAIGNYKDKLYIDNGMLYVERKIGSVVLDGSEDWVRLNNAFQYQTTFPSDIRAIGATNDAKSNYFKYAYYPSSITSLIQDGEFGWNSSKYLTMRNDNYTIASDFKIWLSTHNTELNYILSTSVIEELGEVTIPSTYKGITHIDTTDELEPSMSIEYVRNTQITDYVEEHIAQIKVNEEGITQRVETIEDSDYNSRISAVEQKQTDTDVTIDIISTNIDKTNGNVKEVTTETGFTFNATGMSIKQDDFEILQTPQGAYYKEGNNVVGQYTKDGSKQKDLALFGVYYYGMKEINSTPMFVAQLYNDENGEECFGHFFNGEV